MTNKIAVDRLISILRDKLFSKNQENNLRKTF